MFFRELPSCCTTKKGQLSGIPLNKSASRLFFTFPVQDMVFCSIKFRLLKQWGLNTSIVQDVTISSWLPNLLTRICWTNQTIDDFTETVQTNVMVSETTNSGSFSSVSNGSSAWNSEYFQATCMAGTTVSHLNDPYISLLNGYRNWAIICLFV